MKVILNVITYFDGVSLKPGDEIDVPLKVYQRWINRGIAHKCEEVKVEKVKELTESIKKPKKRISKKKSK